MPAPPSPGRPPRENGLLKKSSSSKGSKREKAPPGIPGTPGRLAAMNPNGSLIIYSISSKGSWKPTAAPAAGK